VSRKLDSCAQAASEVTAEYGVRAFPYACHVGRWDEVGRLADAAWEFTGRLDVLVNNAGMSPRYGAVADVSEELFDKVVGVNLKGPFRLAALVGTRMAAHGSGSIVNISSVGSVRPQPNAVPYSAAKAGVNAVTVAVAHLFGPAVRVNTVVPGRFLTDVSAHWSEEEMPGATALTALRRAGQPDEIAGAVLYLASDASSYTSGAMLRVDGGWEP
jgi:NAD(P)-dependent dehydrogenase (short-subunit alcohol dehydrogenase family)